MIFKSIILLIACFFVSLSEADSGKERILLSSFLSSKNLTEEAQKKVSESVSKKPAKLLKGSQKGTPENIPDFDKDNPQAKGIILTFHRWPNKEESALVLEEMTKAGLKKKSEFKRFQNWVFEWPEWHKGTKAEKLCKRIKEKSALAFLKHCEPDYLLGPAQLPHEGTHNQNTNKTFQILQTNPGSPLSLLRGKNITDCNLVSSRFNGSVLSDYWAQERVGADLLKEELKKVPPIKKHLVSVFDMPKEGHDVAVKSLISDEGKHSVLPELGSSLSMFHSYQVSDHFRHVNRLLDKVDDVCGNIDYPSQN